MSENTKLDPATLTATVQEVFPPPPALAGWLAFYYDSGGVIADDRGWWCTGKAHATREEALCDLSAFRPFEGSALVKVGQASALFAPATEKVETTADRIAADLKAGTFRGAQPEPAAPGTFADTEGTFANESNTFKPAAQGEMPEEVRLALERLRFDAQRHFNEGEFRIAASVRGRADALESWWRTHSQPVAVGMTEELTDLLGAVDAIVSLTPGWSIDNETRVLLAHLTKIVRWQAAQGRKVELPKVREFLERKGWSCEQAQARLDALAEIDAAEGRK